VGVQAHDMLRADIEVGQKVATQYDRAFKEIREPDLRELLTLIRDHRLSRIQVIDDLLKEREER